jgi:hypothetical protein
MRHESQSRVYFIEAVGLNVVKIGFARDITERIRKLAPGCPAPLRLLGTVPGDLKIEQHYHERLAAHRTHGEWFKLCPALEAIISGIDAPNPPPKRPDPRAAKMNAHYEANADRLFRSWAEQKRQKEEAAARRRQDRKTAEIAARL